MIFFGLFLDIGIRLITDRAPAVQWFKWLTWGGIVVGVGFLNPSFAHPLISMLAFPEEWKILIQEYQSPLMYANVPPVYILALMTLLTLVLLWRQHRFGLLIVTVILSYYALSMARVVAPAGIVILCIFALVMSAIDLKSVIALGTRRRQGVLGTIVLLVFLIPLLSDVISARAYVRENLTMFDYFPEQMVDYMQDSGKHGRILNEYELGGYLLDRLAPESTVYIDGRTEILYPLQHYVHFLSVMQDVKPLQSDLEKYNIDLAVLRNTAEKARIIYQTGLMQLDYADVRYFLYTREDAQYPAAGLLWGQPYCWNQDFTASVTRERQKAIFNLSQASPLIPFLNFVASYAQAANGADFLSQTNPADLYLDPTKRFAGYQALNQGLYELAHQLFSHLSVREPKDYLALALVTLESGHPAEAEDILDEAMKIKWNSLEFTDSVLLEALLRKIQQTSPLKDFDTAYVDSITAHVGQHSLSASGEPLSAESFCLKLDEKPSQ